jgi:hypothetical protein
MNYNTCKVCGSWGDLERHNCPPKWEAIDGEDGDEDSPYYVFAWDAEEAAEKLADKKFADWDYPAEMEIWVRQSSEAPWLKFYVEVRSEPVFTARDKK